MKPSALRIDLGFLKDLQAVVKLAQRTRSAGGQYAVQIEGAGGQHARYVLKPEGGKWAPQTPQAYPAAPMFRAMQLAVVAAIRSWEIEA